VKTRFVVNADDFGKDEESTLSILTCFEKGWIDRTTLMVNMPYAETAVDMARAAGVADRVGLHLNFTQGRPLTKPIQAFDGVCDETGLFKVHTVGCGFRRLPPDLLSAIAGETRAQIERFNSFGLPLRHCDGHHHVHNRFGIYGTVLPILSETHFASVRNRGTLFGPVWRGLRGRLMNANYGRAVRRLRLQTTDGFGGWEGETLEKWGRHAEVEIMVHPHQDAEGQMINVTNARQHTGPRMEDLCVRR